MIDNGPGLRAGRFQPPVRAFPAAFGEAHGRRDSTGLGLFIVKRIVDLHGGSSPLRRPAPVGAQPSRFGFRSAMPRRNEAGQAAASAEDIVRSGWARRALGRSMMKRVPLPRTNSK